MKMTSAYANKMLKKLQEDKAFYEEKEQSSSSYVAAIDEEPVIPEYDYRNTAAQIEAIDEQVIRIKHAINLANVTNTLETENGSITIDGALVRMAQLTRRKMFLDGLRKMEPKTRINNSGYYSGRKSVVEYRYINFDLKLIQEEYLRIDRELASLQIALDKYNQTFEFEVEI